MSVRSRGQHTLDVGHKADFGGVESYIREKFHFYAEDKTQKNKFSVNSLVKDAKLRHKIEFLCASADSSCIVTNDLSYQLCKTSQIVSKIGFDVTGKHFTDAHIGFFGKTKDVRMALGASFDLSNCCKKQEAGCCPCDATINWRMLFQSTPNTRVGFDYQFKPCTGENDVTVGFCTQIAEGLRAKAKLSQKGHIDAAFKAKLNDDWNLITSTGLEATALHGRSEARFGVSLAGKI